MFREDEAVSAAPERTSLKPGDTLRLTLILQIDDTEIRVELKVNIVAKPVIPTPEAAYGLLRRQVINGQEQTECVRFAWGATANRIELICPDDLTTEVVRRRAVFQWVDAARPDTVQGYAIQKITQTGSTHWPEFSKNDD